MRMWMVPPELLCDKHLLGEHVETHMIRGSMLERKNLQGYFRPTVLIEPKSLKQRHDALAYEMEKRGMNHRSPFTMPDISYLPQTQQEATVNHTISTRELLRRCSDCAKRINPELGLNIDKGLIRTRTRVYDKADNVVRMPMISIKHLLK